MGNTRELFMYERERSSKIHEDHEDNEQELFNLNKIKWQLKRKGQK